ncbi:hypothetical protein GCM10007387_40100 [Pseudoduganella albidiflava]|uniref:Uncharacterized protein n=1 Tax=Pseudoduganella albidiflava TaxID=321983 RepID=A0AA87XUR1_9BURK|nr:hypothetical protein GCM10007387_40100 [Pseudoduganella albidiflava]
MGASQAPIRWSAVRVLANSTSMKTWSAASAGRISIVREVLVDMVILAQVAVVENDSIRAGARAIRLTNLGCQP